MSTRHPDHPNLIVFDHPLIQHKLTILRDRTTGHRAFRALLNQIAGLMVYEVTRTFRVEPIPVETPMETTQGCKIATRITVCPVLRAGLGMADGILELMPEARVGHIGMYRDEDSLEPVAYLNKLPKDVASGPVLLVDPMLATGGSAVKSVSLLHDAGCDDVRMISLVASPEGVRHMERYCPDVLVYAVVLDRKLDDNGFILPGLGDAGDRLFGTK